MAQKIAQPSEQEAEVVAGAGEDGVGGVANAYADPVLSEKGTGLAKAKPNEVKALLLGRFCKQSPALACAGPGPEALPPTSPLTLTAVQYASLEQALTKTFDKYNMADSYRAQFTERLATLKPFVVK